MTTLKNAKRIIESEMKTNGTMEKIDARANKHLEAAKKLGFASAQDAFNSAGKDFLRYANK